MNAHLPYLENLIEETDRLVRECFRILTTEEEDAFVSDLYKLNKDGAKIFELQFRTDPNSAYGVSYPDLQLMEVCAKYNKINLCKKIALHPDFKRETENYLGTPVVLSTLFMFEKSSANEEYYDFLKKNFNDILQNISREEMIKHFFKNFLLFQPGNQVISFGNKERKEVQSFWGYQMHESFCKDYQIIKTEKNKIELPGLKIDSAKFLSWLEEPLILNKNKVTIMMQLISRHGFEAAYIVTKFFINSEMLNTQDMQKEWAFKNTQDLFLKDHKDYRFLEKVKEYFKFTRKISNALQVNLNTCTQPNFEKSGIRPTVLNQINYYLSSYGAAFADDLKYFKNYNLKKEGGFLQKSIKENQVNIKNTKIDIKPKIKFL